MAHKEKNLSELDLSKLRTYSVHERESLVTVEQFAKLVPPAREFQDFLDSLPDIYVGGEFKTLVRRIAEAKRKGRPVIFAIGGHVIKCGLSPVIIDLMERGVVTGLAMNGAGAIHDFEVGLVGHTSEDVKVSLGKGKFGMARETTLAVNEAAKKAQKEKSGLGRALGEIILDRNDAKHPDHSLCAAAYRLNLPVTIHVAVGTDINHMHHEADGAAIGAATMLDFRKVCQVVAGLNGGVWCNVGCAVILPEVFMKAVSVVVNLGHSLDEMCTANLDMMRQYRPETNVVHRPPGTGVSIAGHHEILLPLLRVAVLSTLEGK